MKVVGVDEPICCLIEGAQAGFRGFAGMWCRASASD